MDLKALITQKENPKLDFKRQWYWDSNTPSTMREQCWGECLKDILALTNGNPNPNNINKTAYLIIGIEDESKKCCQFELPRDKKKNIFTESKLQQTLLSRLNTYSQPEFTSLNVEYKNFQEHEIIIISIPAREKLLSLSKDLKLKNGTDKKGTTYYRIGEEIRVASADVHEEYFRARKENIQDISKIIEKLGGKEEDFLKKYFGDDYKIVLENPQTYTNLKYKLLLANSTLDSILKEKEELEDKIKSQQFDAETQKKVQLAIHELRFSDAVSILDIYSPSVLNAKESMYQVHYLKAIIHIQNLEYQKAQKEIEYIPYLKVDDIGLLNDYAKIYELVGNYPKAIEIYDFIVSDKLQVLQSDLYLLTMLCNNIAQVSTKVGHTKNVEIYYSRALEIMRKNGASNSEEFATVSNNLGTFLKSISRYDEAYKYISDALTIRKELFGEDYTETMQSYNNLATLYVKVAEYSKAEAFFDKVLKFKLKNYGDCHPEIAEIYNNIAELQRKRGKYDFEEVESLYLDAIKIVENFFGENHDLLANKFNNIGELYRENNQPKDALKYYKKALDIYLASFLTEEHPIIATVYGNMALVYQELDNDIQAYNYHKKSLDIREKVLNKNDYYIGLSHANLTGYYNIRENFSKAYFHVCKVVKIWKSCLPENHPDLLQALETKNMLGKIL